MVIGLTGGMGSGKTTVANYFKELGIPIYIADDAAKALMNTNTAVRAKILSLFGELAYKNDEINRKYIANQVFNDKQKLQLLNAIIHPAVVQDFQDWKEKQESPYVIYEAAILFETGGYKNCDKVILVTSAMEERVKRLQLRDQSSLKEIESRIQHQWTDDEKRKLADFEITNQDLPSTKKQVRKLHKILINTRKY